MDENPDSLAAWPEWLTPEYSAIHNSLINCMVSALEHCYSSADAAGVDWTEDGWLSCSASNIIGMLRRAGCPPPMVEPVERRFTDEVHAEWSRWEDDQW